MRNARRVSRPSSGLETPIRFASAFGILALLAGVSACGKVAHTEATAPAATRKSPHPTSVTLLLGAVRTTRRACEERIIPKFQAEWRASHGQEVVFRQSYGDGHAQALAVMEGFEADVVILSSDADIESLSCSGILRHDWRTAPHGGDVCYSPVIIAVRKGNPRQILDWSSLTQPGLRVVMPDPWKSEDGRMDLCAVLGAALRGHAGFAPGDEVRARSFLINVLSKHVGEEEDGHSSFQSFEAGTGDVAITREMELIHGRMFGHEYESVIPSSTLRIDTSAAVLDAHVDKHGTREVAEAFLAYLFSPAAQKALAFYGLRPVEAPTAAKCRAEYARVEDLWPIEDLPTWDVICEEVLQAERTKGPSSPKAEDK